LIPPPPFSTPAISQTPPAGRKKYVAYLEWLAEDEPARKQLRFEEMSRGWAIGTQKFKKDLARENRELTGQGQKLASTQRQASEALWQDELDTLLRKLRRKTEDLATHGKSEPWKLALAAALKARTTVTNRWLAATLHMGNLHEVSRKVAAWSRSPDPALIKRLTPNPKA
jgi:putative transposase